MRILITGASGFVGHHLISHLSREKDTTLFAAGRKAPNYPAVNNRACDPLDKKALAVLVKESKPDVVYHLSGISRIDDSIGIPEYHAGNFLTTTNLIECLQELGTPARIFFASSVHVYGNQTKTVDETTAVNPMNPYGFTKYLAEMALREATENSKTLGAVVGRLYSCIGPGQSLGFVTSDLADRIAKLPLGGQSVLKVGPLNTFRRFLDIRDTVALFPKLVAASPTPFEIYNIASPHEVTIGDLLTALLRIAGKSPRVESSDPGTNRFLGLHMSIEKLTRTLPGAHFRPIEESLRDIYQAKIKG